MKRTRPGWVQLPCDRCENQNEMAQRKAERTRAAQKTSMLKKRFLEKTFANFKIYSKKSHQKQSHALEAAKEFAHNFGHHANAGTWLLFMGGVGTGKGHLCAAIINELISQGYTSLYIKMPKLLRQVKDTFNKNSDVTQTQILSPLESVDLLLIDEVGLQFGTETERMIIYDILDARYEDMKPTILTTNVTSLKTLENLLGERITDRFFEGDSRTLTFDWKSYRRIQRSQ